MFQATELICEALLHRDIKCKVREKGGMSLVEVAFSGRNYASVRLYFISNTEGNDVAVRAAELVKFRYVKFVVDPEKSVVNMDMDIPSRCENVGAVAEELLIRAVAILDEVYPKLMQATWA